MSGFEIIFSIVLFFLAFKIQSHLYALDVSVETKLVMMFMKIIFFAYFFIFFGLFGLIVSIFGYRIGVKQKLIVHLWDRVEELERKLHKETTQADHSPGRTKEV